MGKNYVLATLLYSSANGIKKYISRQYICHLLKKFEETGSVGNKIRVIEQPKRS